MKYCGEQGCKQLIATGRYCDNHRRKKKKKLVYSKNQSFYKTQAWKDLKADCYQRDKGCCVRCGKFVFGKQAHHHHKVPIQVDPSLKLEKENVITVCPKCHMILENEDKKQMQRKFNWNL